MQGVNKVKQDAERVIHAQMKGKDRTLWVGCSTTKRKSGNIQRLYRNISLSAAAVLVLSMVSFGALQRDTDAAPVTNMVTADFDYDETLGRLQFVSNILPESAMVFLENESDSAHVELPSDSEIVHVWSPSEPWLEFAANTDVFACAEGEVMTVMKNRNGEYTVRLQHDTGSESIYSGLTEISVHETDQIGAGQKIGSADGKSAFELRRDGMSILPEFNKH